jgi:hypothetical protein
MADGAVPALKAESKSRDLQIKLRLPAVDGQGVDPKVLGFFLAKLDAGFLALEIAELLDLADRLRRQFPDIREDLEVPLRLARDHLREFDGGQRFHLRCLPGRPGGDSAASNDLVLELVVAAAVFNSLNDALTATADIRRAREAQRLTASFGTRAASALEGRVDRQLREIRTKLLEWAQESHRRTPKTFKSKFDDEYYAYFDIREGDNSIEMTAKYDRMRTEIHRDRDDFVRDTVKYRPLPSMPGIISKLKTLLGVE